MSDADFDTALIAAAFRIAGEEGWHKVNVVAAARAAGLPLPEARQRFPMRAAILLRFGRMADSRALEGAPSEGPVRDRLFDLLMRRYDALQPHRAGIKALMRVLPRDPGLTLMLHCATHRSMRWMLQAAGCGTDGPLGDLRMRGLTGIWYWGLRTWERDETEDLSSTMATVDTALHRADRVASWMQGRRADVPPPPPVTPGAGEIDPSSPPRGGTPGEGPSPGPTTLPTGNEGIMPDPEV